MKDYSKKVLLNVVIDPSRPTIKIELDRWADIRQVLGEYTDELDDWVVVREYKEFYGRLTEAQKHAVRVKMLEPSSVYRCFRPLIPEDCESDAERRKLGLKLYEMAEAVEDGTLSLYMVTFELDLMLHFDLGSLPYRIEQHEHNVFGPDVNIQLIKRLQDRVIGKLRVFGIQSDVAEQWVRRRPSFFNNGSNCKLLFQRLEEQNEEEHAWYGE